MKVFSPRPTSWNWFGAVCLLGLSVLLLAGLMSESSVRADKGATADRLQYNRDIRPILAENCFACHGPDKAARKGDLRLDIREEAIRSGAVVPGKPAESSLIERIHTSDARQLMPPPKSHKKLTAQQKQMLERWIREGAEYQLHWAYIPPTRPAVPVVRNPAWVRNSIDAFVLAELEKRGLSPAPEADRRTLARRLSLDLRGVPPTPAEVEAFVKDTHPNAYERLVDQFLADQRWGEHRGRYWLDAARYADTHGIHFDNYREMWSYRDWVIQAFNRNQPFDQFTIEQLAGDLLPNPTLDQRVATGFNRCNITTNEGGVIPEEYLVLYTRDRTETMAQVWMGMTANCAVCHDHKLDPVSQREFYQMAAFFNNTTQGAMDGNIKDTPPVITVPRMEDRPRWITLVNMLGQARQQVEQRKQAARADFQKWFKSAKPEQIIGRLPAEGLQLQAALAEGKGDSLNVRVAGQLRQVKASGIQWEAGHVADRALKTTATTQAEIAEAGDFDRNQPFSVGLWFRLPAPRVTGALVARMDDTKAFRGWDVWVQNGQLGMHLINTWPSNALKVVLQNRLTQPNQWHHLFITHDGSGKAAGLRIYLDGELQAQRVIEADNLTGTTRTTVPLKIGQRHTTSRLNDLLVQDLRLYTRELPADQIRSLTRGTRAAHLLTSVGKGKPTDALFDWWLNSEDTEFLKRQQLVDQLTQEEAAIKARGTVAHVSQEAMSKPIAYILYRGDYDKRRDAVTPDTPKVLPPMPDSLPRNRLGLAKWLVQPGHPLTARVTVNRFWQEVFGTGLVRTSGDFGIAGELPSHPELLDWLALEFQEKGWNVKEFFRLMVTSATYRQSAEITPLKREKDPANTWLSRGPRFRMDAEMIRDYALAASGLLVNKIGGPSVKPYQPEGVWEAVAMIGSNTRNYQPDSGENLYRRSLYTFWKRSAPPASMEIFNAPNRETCVVRRDRTNTPLQALVTLNDVQFVEAARVLASKALQAADTTSARLDFLAQRVLIRPFRAEEQKVVEGLLNELLAHYRDRPAEAGRLIAFGESKADPALNPSELAAWTMLVNSLFNLDEVLCK
jgi:hypothetical protein